MEDDEPRRRPGPGAADRSARLAAALRENLKRRKAQARGRTAGAETDGRDEAGADC